MEELNKSRDFNEDFRMSNSKNLRDEWIRILKGIFGLDIDICIR